jgi:hypothetical protein
MTQGGGVSSLTAIFFGLLTCGFFIVGFLGTPTVTLNRAGMSPSFRDASLSGLSAVSPLVILSRRFMLPFLHKRPPAVAVSLQRRQGLNQVRKSRSCW